MLLIVVGKLAPLLRPRPSFSPAALIRNKTRKPRKTTRPMCLSPSQRSQKHCRLRNGTVEGWRGFGENSMESIRKITRCRHNLFSPPLGLSLGNRVFRLASPGFVLVATVGVRCRRRLGFLVVGLVPRRLEVLRFIVWYWVGYGLLLFIRGWGVRPVMRRVALVRIVWLWRRYLFFVRLRPLFMRSRLSWMVLSFVSVRRRTRRGLLVTNTLRLFVGRIRRRRRFRGLRLVFIRLVRLSSRVVRFPSLFLFVLSRLTILIAIVVFPFGSRVRRSGMVRRIFIALVLSRRSWKSRGRRPHKRKATHNHAQINLSDCDFSP